MSAMLRTRSSSRSAAQEQEIEHVSPPPNTKKLPSTSGSRITSLLNFGFALLVLAIGGWQTSSFLFSLSNTIKSNTASSQPASLSVTLVQEDAMEEGAPPLHKLRFDWSNMPVVSDMAKQILEHQSDCSLQMTRDKMRATGLGSSIHGWGRNICRVLAQGKHRLIMTMNHPWIFRDEEACNPNDTSVLQCYFPGADALCPNDPNRPKGPIKQHREYKGWCDEVMGGTTKEHISAFRAATTEFLFHNVSNVVINEAERQLRLVFPDGVVPPKLITVHIRWGDKSGEMRLQPMDRYIEAVNTILAMRNESDMSHANIFLATEDRNAVRKFKDAVPKGWNVYVDQYFSDMLQYRTMGDEGTWQTNNLNAEKSKGRSGLVALGSLLLSMEADDFVLTTGSNWSRLMNELRKNVLDPRCNGCTHMVDLSPGEE